MRVLTVFLIHFSRENIIANIDGGLITGKNKIDIEGDEQSTPVTIEYCFDDDKINYAPEIDSVINPTHVQQFQQNEPELNFVTCNEMDSTDAQYSFVPDLEITKDVPCKCNEDGLEMFFKSIISTIRQFPPVEIARTKIEINNIVGAKEVSLLEGTYTGAHILNLGGTFASGIHRVNKKE